MCGGAGVTVVPENSRRLYAGDGVTNNTRLDAFCFFGANQYSQKIERQLEKPGKDKAVDMCGARWAGYRSMVRK